ncbi:putative DNA mismatch repair protein mutS L359, partial [Tetrabaena socialis]
MTIFEEYDGVCVKYKQEYGSVVVLFEVGTFYEIYGCDNGERGCDVRAICGLLNIQATRKNKGVDVSPSNPELGGFPSAALPKYLPTLVNAGYTVIVVNQSNGKGKTVTRAVCNVVSKGTWIDDCAKSATHLLALTNSTQKSKLLGCGAALIDLRTGRSHVMEAWSVDGSDVMEEIGSRIACFDVCEVLLMGDEDAFDRWSGRLELMGVHRNMLHRSLANFCNPGYQDQVLLKAFKSVGFLTPAEFVGLERHPLALTAYVAVLDFAHKHDESLIYNLPVPTVLVSTSAATYVKLSSSTLRNLNLTQARDDASGELCLSRLLDHCVTYPGKRLFRERLLQPITDTIELNRRYDATEAMRQDH